jgi:hypothetical protein
MRSGSPGGCRGVTKRPSASASARRAAGHACQPTAPVPNQVPSGSTEVARSHRSRVDEPGQLSGIDASSAGAHVAPPSAETSTQSRPPAK